MNQNQLEIISESNDKVTDNVIEYLIARKVSFNRKNVEDFTDMTLSLNNEQESLKEIRIWHRRGKLNLIPTEINNSSIYRYLKKEEDPVIKTFEKISSDMISNKYVGGYIEEEGHNKIHDLYLAKKSGMKIPETLVTNNKQKLIDFKKTHKEIITKPIKYSFFHHTSDGYYNGVGTFLVSDKDISSMNEHFFISIFQKRIIKKYEIRTFFFQDYFYSMAIFSQNDEKTKIDFRNYNDEKPNRNIPFKLPYEILKKLKKFIKQKKMTSGSVDFIVNDLNDFIFLEVNPQGQFHWLSEACNYYIERKIAEIL